MKEKVLKNHINKNLRESFIGLIFFIFGFVVSFSKIAGLFSPFCIAFSMALPKRRSVFSFLGAIVGNLLFLSLNGLIYTFALLIGLSLKVIFNFETNFANSICSMVSFLVPQLFSIFFFPVGLETSVLMYVEVVLCGCITFIFCNSLSFRRDFFVSKDALNGFAGFFVAGVAFLLAFCNLEIFSFNFGRFLAVFSTMEAFLVAGASAGAMFGLLSTIGLTLFTKNFTNFGLTLAVSGFLAGAFKATGRTFQIIMFGGMYFFSCLFLGGFNFGNLVEVGLAVLLTYLVPFRIFNGFANEKNSGRKNFDEKFAMNEDISFKLQFTASALIDLQNTIKKCAKQMDLLVCEDITDIYDKSSEEVCKSCGLNNFCWVTSFSEVMRSFNEISLLLRKSGTVCVSDLPIFLKQKCCKQQELVRSINFNYRDFVCKEQTSRRINEVRAVAAEQFTGMAELLIEMSKEVSEIYSPDYSSALVVKEIIKSKKLTVSGIFCFLDRYSRLTIEIYSNFLFPEELLKEISQTIGETFGKDIEFPTITKAGCNYKISFFEAANLGIDFAALQFSPNGNSCCGDSYDYFMDGKGYAHMLLSDGMGNGKRAAVDSLMTCSTMRKLIETGFGFNSTIKLLNLSFSIKSKDESLATIDTCTIDLYSGTAKFIKAGATTSYVSSCGKVIELTSNSLPIGIIQGISFDSKEVKLSKGDVVVMVSDGATASGFEWVSAELKLLETSSAKQIASNLLKSAKKRSNPSHMDDITVMVSKII